MHTFVIVHGAWDGGWFWSPIADRLRARGHRAYAVTLTGLGERSHLVESPIDLAVHISDILHVIEFEKLEGVHLVGHSYGGFPITGIADRIPERIAQVIYVDAYVPSDGQSVMDQFPPELAASINERAAMDFEWLPFTGEVYDERVRPHPLASLRSKLVLSSPDLHGLPRAFVHCTDKGDPVPPMYQAVEEAAKRAQREGWRYATLPTGHNPNLTLPDQTSSLLVQLAEGR